MANNSLRLGVIGLGNIARQHIDNVVKGRVSGCQISAICSRNIPPIPTPESAKHFTDYRDLIDNGDCDAVLVATPTRHHLEAGLATLDAGLHLLMEKPLALSTLQAQRMLDRCGENQRFAVVLNQRFNPLFQTMKSVIDERRLGEIQRTHWTMTNWFRPNAYFEVSDWRATWVGEGGGLLLNQCIHNLDIYQWLCGMPTEVYAQCGIGRYHPIEVEDEATAFFRYANGSSGTFIGSSGEAPGINQFDIVGDSATLSYNGSTLEIRENSESTRAFCATTRDMFGLPESSTADLTPSVDEVNQHALLLQNFVDAIAGNAELATPASEGLNSLALANAMLLSHWQDGRVTCPPDGAIYQEALDQRILTSTLRETKDIDVNIDMNKSYR